MIEIKVINDYNQRKADRIYQYEYIRSIYLNLVDSISLISYSIINIQ
jgi:hypothetical protein